MSVYRYDVVKNGVVTNSWTSDQFGADHYEACFGAPGTYTVNTIDITSQVQQAKIDAQVAQFNAACDAQVNAILAPMEAPTYLMLAIYDVCVASNASGTETYSDIVAAKERIQTYKNLMNQVQQLRAQRDQQIANYLASVGASS
jgi:hypothetical protein